MIQPRDIILSSVYLLGKVWGRTYLQKFIYLFNREVFDEKLFEYSFYKYGPFSQEINEELAELEIEGLVEERAELTGQLNTAYTYELTDSGKKEADKTFNQKIDAKTREKLIAYVNRFRSYTPTQLLRFVYAKYPEVAENSEFGMQDTT
jgi:uncharacterized protein YwgA